MQLGSMFISNCNNTLHVSDAFCVHPQEHLKTVITASGVWHAARYMLTLYLAACHTPEAATTVFKCSWGWTQKESETCRVLLQLLKNILPSCITLVLYTYINNSFSSSGKIGESQQANYRQASIWNNMKQYGEIK